MKPNEPRLLTDEQMKTFIVDGVLLLKTDFPKDFHDRLLERLNQVHEEEGNLGNNILPRIREMQKVFEHPVITGALTSVLGPDYLMHTHRHCHYNALPTAGGWHKDSYWGYNRLRNHHPWWAMIMYFPQDTPVELGPTGVMPGSHVYESRTFGPDDSEDEVTANGEAGTFVLIHYDIWHRSTRNLTGKPRYMLKFEFMRTVAPSEPTWNYEGSEWSVPEAASAVGLPQEEYWQDSWNWLRGEIGSRYGKADTKHESLLSDLAGRLTDSDERIALNAAYGLATCGEAGRDVLLDTLIGTDARASLLSAYGLSACGADAVEGLTRALDDEKEHAVNHAAFALGELRHYADTSALKLVSKLGGGSSAKVRRTIADSLGMIGRTAQGETVDGLIACLKDEDAQVRFTAGLSLIKLGRAAEAAIPYLAEALEDDNRYVQGHAIEALRYIDTEQSRAVLLHELMQSRWCPSTTKASTF